MKKKMSVILLAFVLVLSLAGCGSKEKQLADYNMETMEGYSDMIIQSFQVMSDTEFDMFKSYSDYQLDYTLMSSGLPIDSDDFLVMIESWQSAVKEYGDLIDYEEYTAEESNNGVVLTAPAEFENENADIVISFDKDERMVSMTVDVHYTMGEILKKAGLNTLLGMGTVFLVLIFIAFIISLFRFIPNPEQKKQEEIARAKAQAAPIPEAVLEEPIDDEMADSELVAVIAAAIAAAEGTSTDGFIVRSIRRRKTNNWK